MADETRHEHLARVAWEHWIANAPLEPPESGSAWESLSREHQWAVVCVVKGVLKALVEE